MSEERDDDDLIDPFPVPATDDVLSDDDSPESGREGIEGEEREGPPDDLSF